MKSFGQYLREEREKRGVSLEEVNRRTRISLKMLASLEGGDLPTLPPPTILRGFLKSYAEAVGLDPREVQSRYSQAGEIAPRPIIPVQSVPEPRRPSLALIAAVVGSVLIIGLALWLRSRGAEPLPPLVRSPAPAPMPQEFPADLPPPVEESVPQSPAHIQQQELREPVRGHVLRAQAAEQTWLRLTRDGGPVSEYLLRPGEKVSWAAAERFQLTVGNAGGVMLSLDGSPLGSLGESGQVVSLTLPRPPKPPARPETPR